MNKILSKSQVEQWKTKGWVIIKNMVNVEQCYKDMKKQYPLDAKNPIQDFGSGGLTNFPCKYLSLNEITVHPKLISAVQQLLNEKDIILTQSVAWAKYCVKEKGKSSSSNHDQRIHMDWGNNYWTHPPMWENPDMVTAIVYYSDTKKTGGSTAVVSRNGDKDEVYQWPYICMPGIAGKPFFNDRKTAEASMSEKDRKLRKKCYQREVCPEPGMGDVLFYRMDLWHRGTPIKPNNVRYVHNLAWKKKSAEGINIWNKGWTQKMYYGWLEEFISKLTKTQLKTLGFPDINMLSSEIKDAVLARYPLFSKL
tara:strand:- start:8160 stop:9083 length:924 start_codon:yes stop_codon:yes gene_type:complete